MIQPTVRRWVLFLSVGLLVLLTAIFLRQPIIAPEALTSAEQDLRELPTAGCRRPVLHGPTIEGSGTEALRTLIDPNGAFARCMMSERRDYHDARRGELAPDLLYHFPWDETDPEQWDFVGVYAPPYPSEHVPRILRSIQRDCAGLPAAIEAVIAHEEVCTPWEWDSELELRHAPALSRLHDGLITLAFRRAYEGHAVEALSWLLDGARLAQDIGRGQSSPTIGIVTEGMIRAFNVAFSTLLQTRLSLSDEDIEMLDQRLQQLAASHPHPQDIFRTEGRSVARDLARAPGRDAAFTLWTHHQVSQTEEFHCLPSGTAAACLDALWEQEEWWTAPSAFETWIGPQLEHPITRRYHLGSIARDIFAAHHTLAKLRFQGALTFSALRVTLAFHAARRSIQCPAASDLPANVFLIPEADERFSIRPRIPGKQYEVAMPAAVLAEDIAPYSMSLLRCPGDPIQEAGTFYGDDEPIDQEALMERNAGLPEAMRLGPLAPNEEVSLPANQ